MINVFNTKCFDKNFCLIDVVIFFYLGKTWQTSEVEPGCQNSSYNGQFNQGIVI